MHMCLCWVFLLDYYVYGDHDIGVKLFTTYIYIYVYMLPLPAQLMINCLHVLAAYCINDHYIRAQI